MAYNACFTIPKTTKQSCFTALEPGQSIQVSQHQNHSRFTPISYHHTNYYCRTNTPLSFVFHLLRTTASPGFNSRSSMSLSTTSFQVFLGLLLCLAPTTSKAVQFLLHLHHLSLRHVHTILIYFTASK